MTRLNRIYTTCAVVLLLVFAASGTRAFTVDGYYKNFFVVDHLPEAVHLTMGVEEPWLGSVSQRLRLNGFHRFDDRLAFNISYALVARVQDPVLFREDPLIGFFNAAGYRVADLDVLLFPRDESEVRSFALLQNLDRLFFTVSLQWLDLYVGRQAIAWGSARVINPTDVIAPFLYTELDTEDRIGVDAVRLRAPLGALSEIDVGYIAGEDFKFKESAFFLRGKTYAARTDLAGLIVGFREHLMIGADVTRAIGGAGSWFEAAYVFADALSERRSGTDEDYLRLSLGCDYSFPGNIYGYIEYHFNQAGADRAGEYWQIVDTPAYRDGAVYLLGEHYIAPGASFQITPLVTLLTQALVNLNDPSALLVPILEYNIREDIYLEFGAYLGAGESPDIFIVPFGPFIGTPIPVFNSEFGTYPDIYYTSFRVYF